MRDESTRQGVSVRAGERCGIRRQYPLSPTLRSTPACSLKNHFRCPREAQSSTTGPSRKCGFAELVESRPSADELKPVDQPASVRIVADNLVPDIAPSHHVIEGALKFDPHSLWHVGRFRLKICQKP
jgi:hypothetical protein